MISSIVAKGFNSFLSYNDPFWCLDHPFDYYEDRLISHQQRYLQKAIQTCNNLSESRAVKVEGNCQEHAEANKHEHDHVDLNPSLCSHPVHCCVQEKKGDKVLADVDGHNGLTGLLYAALYHICYSNVRAEDCPKGDYRCKLVPRPCRVVGCVPTHAKAECNRNPVKMASTGKCHK